MRYAAEHASALADLTAAGTAVTFTSRTPGSYDPDTDTTATDAVVVQCAGYAIGVTGDPIRYKALELTQQDAVTLLFAPSTYGRIPKLGATCTWSGATYVVRDVEPLAPDGTAITARVICAGSGEGVGTDDVLLDASFYLSGSLG